MRSADPADRWKLIVLRVAVAILMVVIGSLLGLYYL